jgi:hypothetical protein
MMLRRRSEEPRAEGQGSSLAHAASLVLPAAAARTGIVSTNFEMSLFTNSWDGEGLPFKRLPLPESDELFDKRPTMSEKTLIARTKIIESCFAIRCPEDAILRTPAIAHGPDLASLAITG